MRYKLLALVNLLTAIVLLIPVGSWIYLTFPYHTNTIRYLFLKPGLIVLGILLVDTILFIKNISIGWSLYKGDGLKLFSSIFIITISILLLLFIKTNTLLLLDLAGHGPIN